MGKLFFITLFIFYIYPINSQTQKCESELNGVIIDFQNTNALVGVQMLVLDKNYVLQTVISSNVDNFKIKSD